MRHAAMYGPALASLLMATTMLAAPPPAGQPVHEPQDVPLPPEEAARAMRVPEGFRVELFAAEPDLVQPIWFTFDARGRLWVAENTSYPHWSKTGEDRVLIFEDRDGDGHFDERKVFWSEGNYVTSIEVGFGGLFVTSCPDLLFVPDAEGDDVPDGPPRVLLDGWSPKGIHNAFTGLTWGPDGWLYGAQGILSPSRVGKPGMADSERVPFNCGVWRYHPVTEAFEVVAHGTTNPWGLDFDEHGQLFISNCVIPHLFRVLPGMHFIRMFGRDFDPHLYGLIESSTDHIHWAGGAWQSSRGGSGQHGEAGGGHAHAGAMIYLGDNWPDEYRGSIFLSNLHGRRINHDVLEREGAGFTARHRPDFLQAGDRWFQGLNLRYGPDGSVFLSDWVDDGECHGHDAHRSSGRIFRIVWDDPAKPPARALPLDWERAEDAAIVGVLLEGTEWYSRHARRILQERAAEGAIETGALDRLHEALTDPASSQRTSLRALWGLHSCGAFDEKIARPLLESPHEWVRAWSVQLALEDRVPSQELRDALERAARSDSSAALRLYLAAGLQRLPVGARLPLAEALVAHTEDADDREIPHMLWYGIEDLIESDPLTALPLAKASRIPIVQRNIGRRLGDLATARKDSRPLDALVDAIVEGLAEKGDLAQFEDLLAGLLHVLEGQRDLPLPGAWTEFRRHVVGVGSERSTAIVTELSLIFGDRQARDQLLARSRDPGAPASLRERAIGALARHGEPAILEDIEVLLDDRAVRRAALRALAAYSDGRTPRLILSRYARLDASARADAIATLASRRESAVALLDAIEIGTRAARRRLECDRASDRRIPRRRAPQASRESLGPRASELCRSTATHRRLDEAPVQPAQCGAGYRRWATDLGSPSVAPAIASSTGAATSDRT